MENELYHYGVKGMKWGVRKARKRAAKEGVKGRSRHSTGKNYDEVYSRMSKEKQAINKKYVPRYQKLIKDTVDYNNKAQAGLRNPKERQRLASENQKLNSEYYKESMALAKKYTDQFNRATLKDIGYKNVDKGAEYLKRKGKIIFDVDL